MLRTFITRVNVRLVTIDDPNEYSFNHKTKLDMTIGVTTPILVPETLVSWNQFWGQGVERSTHLNSLFKNKCFINVDKCRIKIHEFTGDILSTKRVTGPSAIILRRRSQILNEDDHTKLDLSPFTREGDRGLFC